MSFAAKTEK